MRWIVFPFIALLSIGPLHGGSVEPFGGDAVSGKVELDFGGFVFRPAQGPAVKLDVSNFYRVQFDSPPSDDCVPGVILTDGSRLAAPFGALTDPAIKFPKRNLTISSAEIAWIIYQRFPVAFLANAPAGETGALLPGGDFFSGTIRGADAEAVKVMNSIFGQRRLDSRQHEVFAAVLRAARPLAAQYEIRTTDGSVLGAESLATERTALTLRSPLYDGLKIPVNEIAEIRAGSNRCRSLASIPQVRAEPPAGLRTTPEGGVIMDTKTVTTCPVPAGFTEFVTRVAPGEDAVAGQRIVFSIYANGTAIARSNPMAAGEPPQALRVSLNGARVILLRVEAGGPAGAVPSGRWIQPLFLRR